MFQISVINESANVPDSVIHGMISAFSTQWNRDIRPVWGAPAAEFAVVPQGRTPSSQSWWAVLFDNCEQAGALGYHDWTDEGLPLAKIYVDDLREDEASLSVGISHEICELAVDPWLNGAHHDAHGTFWASEICDPVDDDKYGYEIGGVPVTDFVTPLWFAPAQRDARLDFMGHVMSPYEVLAGGHAQQFDPVSGWRKIAGSQAQFSRRIAECARGTRPERRARQWKSRLERSEPQTWSR